MNDDFAELSALMGTIAGSPMNWELSVRLNQSLEITDGLWELVPVVVASGEAIGGVHLRYIGGRPKVHHRVYRKPPQSRGNPDGRIRLWRPVAIFSAVRGAGTCPA